MELGERELPFDAQQQYLKISQYLKPLVPISCITLIVNTLKADSAYLFLTAIVEMRGITLQGYLFLSFNY